MADALTGGRVLVISLSPELATHARILRQVEFLATSFDVVLAGFELPPALHGVEFVQLESGAYGRGVQAAARVALRMGGLYERAYWADARVRRWRDALAAALPLDAIVVNDPVALPLARELDPKIALVYDAHEHWTSESASWNWRQRLSMRGAHEWIVDRYVPRTSAMMTVSPWIARDFERRTGVRPALVTNAPYFEDLSPSPVEEPIRLFHVGVADRRRRLETTIDAVRSSDAPVTLDVVLSRQNDYRRELELLVASDPRIRLLPPVPREEIIGLANGYDVGVHFLPARQPNHVHALPNKLFDYIQARLAVLIGPSPEMASVVREWDCGVSTASFDPDVVAAALRGLTVPEVERMKRNADRAAHTLTADNNREMVVDIVRGAISSPDR